MSPSVPSSEEKEESKLLVSYIPEPEISFEDEKEEIDRGGDEPSESLVFT